MFYCLKFYFDIIYVVSVDEYYNKLKILFVFCVMFIFFKCLLKSKWYVGIIYIFEIGNMYFLYKFCNFI